MELKSEPSSRRGGVADYFAVLGVGEQLIWQHSKKIGAYTGDERIEEEECEADLMSRFYREIVEVTVIATDLDSYPSFTSPVPSFADDATTSSQAVSMSSTYTPASKPRSSAFLSRSPPGSDVVTAVMPADSISGRFRIRDLDGFTTLYNTCPAGRSSRRRDYMGFSIIATNDTLSGSVGKDMTLWTKSQVFNANLDPCFGFRADVLAKLVQDVEHTPLKQLGRKVGSTLRHQLGPLLPSRDRRPNRGPFGLVFHLAFRRRSPDENDRPAIANFDLRYIKLHRDTVILQSNSPNGIPCDSASTTSAAIRRSLSTGATIAARVAEAGKQKLIDKYKGRNDVSCKSDTRSAQNQNGEGVEMEQSDTILVALDELLQIPEGFECWSIPTPFTLIRIPTKARAEPVVSSSSIRGGRKTLVYSVRLGNYPTIEHVVSEDNATVASDPSGTGVEAYFDGSSFVLTPPSSAAGVEDGVRSSLFPSAGVSFTSQAGDPDLTTSFEVLDPTAFMPRLLDAHELPDVSRAAICDNFIYVPVLALRRQRVGDEERYHEDPAIVDVAVTFRDGCGDPVPPAVEVSDDEEEDDVFHLMRTTPWFCTSENGRELSETKGGNGPLGSPAVLVKRNNPIGFADAAFATSVLDRFPLKNYKGLPLPEEELPMFCYPTGCRLFRTPYSDCPLPQYFGFVVKNEQGDSIYVSCVSFMEPMSKAKTAQLDDFSNQRKRVSIPHRRFTQRKSRRNLVRDSQWGPMRGSSTANNDAADDDELLQGFDEMTTFENKTICLVSRYPFWTAFRRFLSHLHLMSGSPSALPVERYISHLLLSVPLPRPGGPCVLVPLPALNCSMVLCVPPNKDLPLVDLPFQTLFACLDVATVVTIAIGLLSLERKLLVISTRPSLLLDVCELLKALLFPFELCAPYVPRLTEPFMSCLDFPGAIFVGIHDDGRRDGLAAMVRKDLPEDSTIVDLDTGDIDCSGDRYEILRATWRVIPPGPRSILLSEIETLCRDAGIVPGQEPLDSQLDSAFEASIATATIVEDLNNDWHSQREPLDDRAVRDSFLRFFTSILAGYERFLVPPDLDFKTSGSEWFDTQGFLSAASQEHAPYLGSLVATQLFQLFIQRRTEASDVHCLLFDECLAEYHSSPIPYGRLGGDVETVPAISDAPPQMLYSLLVDQCCAESQQSIRGGSFDFEGDASDVISSASEIDVRNGSPDMIVNEYGDLVTTPSRLGIPDGSRFIYSSDGNTFFPQKLNSDCFLPAEPDSLLVEVRETPLPLLVRTEREVEEAIRRRKVASSQKGLRSHSRCLWQLPKLMGSHFLGSWLLCVPAQVSQKGIGAENQSRYLLRALGAMRLLRNRQRIIPDEASYRAMIVACGCVLTDRRVELGKLFGLLRGDGIFPSAVTLGQYTRALAEGYSKRAAGINDDTGGVEVSVGQNVIQSEQKRRHAEDVALNALDGDIMVLEESGRRWRSRFSDYREFEQTDTQNDKGTIVNEIGQQLLATQTMKRKLRNTTRSWHPVVTSSTFVPSRESSSTTSVNLASRMTLVALWSRTTACETCSYVPLDEEIQCGWDVTGDDSEWRTVISCPRCDSPICPRLAYREMSLDEAARVETEGFVHFCNDVDDSERLPAQINTSLDCSDDNMIAYISPSEVRCRLERLMEEGGESVLDRDVLREIDPELFFNFWWYCARFSMPLPLPVAANAPQHKCAFAAWDKDAALLGCRSAASVIAGVFVDSPLKVHKVEANVFEEDFPLLSNFKLQNLSKGDWDHPDLSKILVSLVEACDKRDFKPVIECALECIKKRRHHGLRPSLSEGCAELDCYRTILYLAKYQCTSAFHVFFPATAKPCKGYHYWCAFGTPLPIFDRMFRDAVQRIKAQENSSILIHDVGDVALGFRCVFGHLI